MQKRVDNQNTATEVAQNQVDNQETKSENEKGKNNLVKGKINLDKKKLIFLLDRASLEYKIEQNKPVLINPDRHEKYIIKKLRKEPRDYTPEIVHKALLSILDSPLNKAKLGILEIFIRTTSGVLLKINPNTKIPRTEKRFFNLIAKLLEDKEIKAVFNEEKTSNNPENENEDKMKEEKPKSDQAQNQEEKNNEDEGEVLMSVVQNPIDLHLPENCLKIGTSRLARLVKIDEFVEKIGVNDNILFLVGAVKEGHPGIENDIVEDCISISRYNLTTSNCINRIIGAFENYFGVH